MVRDISQIMKLRAVITVEVDAADFVEAAEHQRRIESCLSELQGVYPGACMTFQERRQRRRGGAPPGVAATPKHATGRLSLYAD